jgi:hypothetical protein
MNKKVISHPIESTLIDPRLSNSGIVERVAHYLRGLPALDIDTITIVLGLTHMLGFAAAALGGAATTIVSSAARIQGAINENPEDRNEAIATQILLILGEVAQITGVSTGKALEENHDIHVPASVGGTYAVGASAVAEAILLTLEVSRLKHDASVQPELSPGYQKRISRYQSKISTNIVFAIGSGLGATGIALKLPLLQLPGGITVAGSIIKGITDNATRLAPILREHIPEDIRVMMDHDPNFMKDLKDTMISLCKLEQDQTDIQNAKHVADWISSKLEINHEGGATRVKSPTGYTKSLSARLATVFRCGGFFSDTIRNSYAASKIDLGETQDTVVNNAVLKFLSYKPIPTGNSHATISRITPEGTPNRSNASSVLLAISLKELAPDWGIVMATDDEKLKLDLPLLDSAPELATDFLNALVAKAKDVYYRLCEGAIIYLNADYPARDTICAV